MKNRLLFLGMMILSLNYVLYNTIGSFNGKNLLRIAAVLFILLHIIFNWRHISIKLQDIIIAVLLIIPFIVLPMNDKVINFGLILLLTISSRTSNYKEIIKNLFFISILSVLLVFIMNLSGIISNTAYTIGERTRYTFGFLNVNAFSLLLYSSLMLYILSRKKVELIHLIVMNIISVGFFMYTDTRSVLVSTILFTFIFILLSFIVKIPRIYYNSELLVHLANFLPIFLLVIILKLRQTFQVIDTATSYRLSFISNYIESNSWSNLLFGGTQVKDVENGFLILIYSLGLFFSLYILIKIIKATHIAFQKNNIRIIAFITSFLVYNLVESAIVRPEVLITMLFWMVIFKQDFIVDTEKYCKNIYL